MNLPKSWNQITVSQYKELRVLGAPSNFFEWQLDVLSILTDTDIDDMSLADCNKHFRSVQWVKREPHHKFTKKIGDFTAIEFKEITFGQFLDLEHYLQNEVEHFTTIASMFYRRTSVDEWGHVKYEPYNYDLKERGNKFNDLPITSIYGIVEGWKKHRNYLVTDAYSNLFEGEIDEEDLEGLSPEEIAEIRKEESEQQKFNKWSWEMIALDLAGGDYTKIKDVLNMKLIFVLNMLSMKADIK